MESGSAGRGWYSVRDPLAGSYECPGQWMFAAAVEQADSLDPASNRLARRQQLDPRATLTVFGQSLDLLQVDQRNHAPLVSDVPHETWRVGEDQQPLRGKRGRDLHRQTIAVDVDGDAVVAEGRWRHHRQIAVLEQQAEEPRLDPFYTAAVIRVEHFCLAVLLDAQIGFAAANRHPPIHRRQTGGIGA